MNLVAKYDCIGAYINSKLIYFQTFVAVL